MHCIIYHKISVKYTILAFDTSTKYSTCNYYKKQNL